MHAASRPLAIVGVASLLLVAGCVSGTGLGQEATPTSSRTDSPTPTATPTPTPTVTPQPTDTDCPRWVSFYGLGGPGDAGWAPDRVAIGYTVPADASVFFVAFEDATVVGTTHVTTEGLDYGVTADGDGIDLDAPMNGSHVIRVRAFADTDGNGEFDVGTDRPCRDGGEAVEAGPRRIDFDRFRGGSTTTDGSSS